MTITVARDTSPVGGGSLPGATLPTAVLKLRHLRVSADELSRRLRMGTPRVFGRIQEDEVILDLRSVLPEDDSEIVRAIGRVCGGAEQTHQ
jgi:L-seryl-tRNA(Ser) seleniumtransferase